MEKPHKHWEKIKTPPTNEAEAKPKPSYSEVVSQRHGQVSEGGKVTHAGLKNVPLRKVFLLLLPFWRSECPA